MEAADTYTYEICRAAPQDKEAIEALIEHSARKLSREYTEQEIDAAVLYVFGVDSEVVSDGTYFVAKHAGKTVGCGGWSRRQKPFGGDQYRGESTLLKPGVDAAKIRAFFTHPDWARKGVASALLRYCEAQAKAAGFTRAELTATLPGIAFYHSFGYQEKSMTEHHAPNGVVLRFMLMEKPL